MFGRLLGRKDDTLSERARALVSVAHIGAVGMFTPLRDKYPAMHNVNLEHWDFIVTVAGVFIATSRLETIGLGQRRKEPLLDTIAESLDKWKPDGLRAFEDCKMLFEREFDRLTAGGHEPRYIGSDALGLWIVWNVLGHAPQTNEDTQLLRSIGVMVVGSMFNYWDGR
jgi:hypothetical protein